MTTESPPHTPPTHLGLWFLSRISQSDTIFSAISLESYSNKTNRKSHQKNLESRTFSWLFTLHKHTSARRDGEWKKIIKIPKIFSLYSRYALSSTRFRWKMFIQENTDMNYRCDSVSCSISTESHKNILGTKNLTFHNFFISFSIVNIFVSHQTSSYHST